MHPDLPQRPPLFIVIVNFRCADQTIACLESLSCEEYVPRYAQVAIIDNCSGDRSVPRLQAEINRRRWVWASVIESPVNGGFAAGNNLACRHLANLPVPPDYVLLLNPDTLVRAGGVAALVEFMEAHSDVGIAGSQLLDAAGAPQCGGFRFPSIPGELESGFRLGLITRLLRRWVVPHGVAADPRQVDWVSGASFMLRREVFDRIGLLDERFFMYYEEVDFCRRARAAGWQVWHVPASKVVHLEGAASGIRKARRPRARYWYESRRTYYTKHHGRLYATAAELAFQAGYSTWRLRRLLQRKPDTDPIGRISDGLRYVVWPALLGS